MGGCDGPGAIIHDAHTIAQWVVLGGVLPVTWPLPCLRVDPLFTMPNDSDRVVGAALFVGLGLGFWQQASGSEAAVYYSPHVLEVRWEASRRGLMNGYGLE